MTFPFSALLFDLDGTLISSIAAVDRAWGEWCRRNSLDVEEILPLIHGRRSIDSIRLVAPHLDAESENAWLRNREATDIDGVYALPGAKEFLDALECPWAIVTSGTSDVATARIRAAGLRIPDVAVYGEDVVKGKPAPDPFLHAAHRLGVDPSECIVFEDTIAGVRSGHAAGMQVIALATTLPGVQLDEADGIIEDFRQVTVERQFECWIARLKT